jgi:hypothetical protein
MSASPSVSYSITVRLEAPSYGNAVSGITRAVEDAGGVVTALDVSGSGRDRLRVDATIAASSEEHAKALTEALAKLDGVEVGKVSDRTFLMHLGGKIEMHSKVALRNRDELSMAYTPGVARVCLALADNPDDARRLTIKRNTVAVVTDGSAVLGLGNIGPIAALPVMRARRRCSSSSPASTPGRCAWTPRTPRRSSARSRPSRRASRASTWRTSARRAASRSSAGCARSWTSRSSTTTSTAPRSSSSPRSPTR